MLNKYDQLHAFLVLLVVLVVSDHLYASISRYDLSNLLKKMFTLSLLLLDVHTSEDYIITTNKL